MNARRRWGFRARLTALIAAVFILGGAVLLSVQYLLVQQLFASGIGSITAGCISGEESWVEFEGDPRGDGPPASCAGMVSLDGGTSDGSLTFGGDGSNGVWQVTVEQTLALSDRVLSGLLLWSIAVLAAFAVLAVLAARWLARSSLGRIARITATTREISQEALDRRLDLPGPQDEIKELGDTIDDMLDRLDEAFTRQERFVAAASHELRTPLTTTRTALEIPLQQGRFPREVEPAVRRAIAANDRSERLIAALLVLARAGTGTASADEAQRVDLVALTRDCAAVHATEAAAHDVHVEIEPSPPLFVTADATLLGIAIGNLVENAVRHNRAGGAVRIAFDREQQRAGLTVENDGRVIGETETARLTEPFHRGEQTRLAGPGTGLGLSLAESIARSLGGELSLAPRRRGGLHVRFAVPAAGPPYSVAPPAATSPRS